MITPDERAQTESKGTDSKSAVGMIALAILAAGLVAAAAVGWWVLRAPLVVMGPTGPGGLVFDANTPEGRLCRAAFDCADRQKDLYLYIDAYVQKHGRVPPDLDALQEFHPMTVAIFGCPSNGPYDIHLENFGDPNAVVIGDQPEAHGNALRLWIKGIRPQVRTMGDGTIHVFNKPNFVTMQAKPK